MVAEVAASTLVSASPEVTGEINTPSACIQASQVNSLIWSA
jgi:hypothetical protein